MNAVKLARTFYEIYERRAPDYGYETREETREFDPTSRNGRLMIDVCREILETGRIPFYGDQNLSKEG